MNQADLRATPWQLSERARKLTSSAIREILKVTERPEVISFAGGLPSPATFPVEEMRHASERILRDQPAAALQYSATEGYMPLREWVAARYSVNGAHIRPTQVLITTGSQQALDLLGKTLVDPGSRVLVETPTYLGALQSFSLFEPHYVQVPTDESGLIPEALDAALTANARLLYAQPNFQNPTGRRLPLERRRALAAFAQKAPFPVIEDDPYGALDYAGAPLPTLLSMAPEHIVHTSSRPRNCTSNWCRRSRPPTCTRRASRSASSTKWSRTASSTGTCRPSARSIAISARRCSTRWNVTCPRASNGTGRKAACSCG
jgi:2-aminoadipate transaminase